MLSGSHPWIAPVAYDSDVSSKPRRLIIGFVLKVVC